MNCLWWRVHYKFYKQFLLFFSADFLESAPLQVNEQSGQERRCKYFVHHLRTSQLLVSVSVSLCLFLSVFPQTHTTDKWHTTRDLLEEERTMNEEVFRNFTTDVERYSDRSFFVFCFFIKVWSKVYFEASSSSPVCSRLFFCPIVSIYTR